jgi:hypothetical protein
MRTSTRSSSPFRAAAMVSAFAIGTLSASAASAQTSSTVDNTPKGIVGGALLGAELGTIIESIAGVRSPWVYVITDVVLGAGGAVGGWEVEKTSSDGRAPIFMLAGGLGLVIPAVVLTLNAVNTPHETVTEDNAPQNAPAANPGSPGRSLVSPGSPPPPPPSGATSERETPASKVHLSLVDVTKTGFHLGVPVPEVRPTFSMSDIRQYGLTQQAEVRMPLVKIAF